MSFNIKNENTLQCRFNHTSYSFIKNIGQFDTRILYYLNIFGTKLFFTSNSIEFSARDIPNKMFTLFFECDDNCRIEGVNPNLYKTNYLFGTDSSKWCTDIPSYKEILFKNLFPLTDLKFCLSDNCLKYEIILHPGSNISKLKSLFRGFDNCSFDSDGSMLLNFDSFTILDKKPTCHQVIDGKSKYYDCSFELNCDNNIKTYGFEISGEFDAALDLIIDPGLVYSTFLGGSNIDFCTAVAGDSYGNMYTAGNTYSSDFPYRPNNPWPYPPQSAFQPTLHGQCNIFVTKFNSTGEAEFSTYIGGSEIDQLLDMAVDDSGNIFVCGFTTSPNFPHTNTFVTALNGNSQCFVIKLNPSGTTFTYGTLIGGSSPNAGYGISIDISGSVYVAGFTKSGDFPTVNAFQKNFGGSCNGFVTKLDPSGSTIIYSTYLGGTGGQYFADVCNDIFVEKNTGTAYVCGYTQSPDFPVIPVSPPPLQPNLKGLSNAFIARYSSSGVLEYSTYFGGSTSDVAQGIYADSSGTVYITGTTSSADFPGTFYPPMVPPSPMPQKAFVSKINLDGNQIIYSLITGTNGRDNGNRIDVDTEGRACIAGLTTSSNFPVTGSAYQPMLLGTQDAFVARVSYAGDRFDYASYLGGKTNSSNEDIDSASSVYYIGNSTVILAGMTASPDFPTTTASPPVSYQAFQPVIGGQWDGFLTKLIMTSPPIWPSGSYLQASNIGVTTLSLNWSPASDPDGITAYALYKDGVLLDITAGNVFTYNLTGLIENTSYTFKVEAENSSQIWTTNGPSLEVSTLPDTTPPEWPKGSSIDTETSVTLIWPPSIDEDGVPIIAYRIYKNGDLIATVGGDVLSYTVTGIQPKTNYTFKIIAGNRAGLWSTTGISTNFVIYCGSSPTRGFSIDDLKTAAFIIRDSFKD